MSAAAIVVLILSLAMGALALAVGYGVFTTRRIAANAERLAPPREKLIEIDGHRIHYVDEGEGRPIVFIHGLGAQLNHFRAPLFPLLEGYRLIALDRPGSGYSVRRRKSKSTLTEHARLVSRFIETLGVEKPLIVGHSLGGAVC